MNEAAEQKLDELIIQSQSETLLFPLDHAGAIVPIDIVYDDETIELFHDIDWPDLAALNDRQQQTPDKTEVLSATRTKTTRADGVTANGVLWNKFAKRVKGYDVEGADEDGWVNVTPELAGEIPVEHKSEAIMGLFASEFKVERPEGKGFVLGATSHRVKQIYGPYTIIHVFTKHHEGDRRKVAGSALDTQYETGTTKPKSISFVALKPYVQFYDKFCMSLEGVKEGYQTRKDLINGIWKMGAVEALMDYFEASRRDLKKN